MPVSPLVSAAPAIALEEVGFPSMIQVPLVGRTYQNWLPFDRLVNYCNDNPGHGSLGMGSEEPCNRSRTQSQPGASLGPSAQAWDATIVPRAP